MKKLNRKGFTLIELLAVIVILSVIILVAVTAIVPWTERTQKRAFITEATTILNGAEAYFINHEMTSGSASCVDIQEDLIGEYIEDKGKGAYDGTVQVDADGNYIISLTNGNGYYIITTDAEIANLDDSVVQDTEAKAATAEKNLTGRETALTYKASCS